jgi:glycosyltransferase involved in cell wall biosynthesis
MSNSNLTPLVSIGIPTYNRPEGLKKTLDYITSQSYSNIEIIISDNCSPNPEVKVIMETYAANDSRIKYFIQKKNEGAWYNFVFVLNQASADYFMWAADDDYWHPSFIEKCMGIFSEKEGYGLVFTKFKVQSDKNTFLSNARANVNFEKLFNINNFFSIMSFLLLDENTHKANFIQGIWDISLIKKTIALKSKIIDNINEYGGDIAILTYALTQTKFYQVPEFLFIKGYNNYCPGSLRLRWIELKNFIINPIENLKYEFIISKTFNASLRTALILGNKTAVHYRVLLKIQFLLHIIPRFMRSILTNGFVYFTYIFFYFYNKLKNTNVI